MGSPRKFRKKFSVPSHPWRKSRIDRENKIVEHYGLNKKREIWKADSALRRVLRQAKKLIATETEQSVKEKKQLLDRLMKYNLLREKSSLDDVLSLKTEDFLDRRLQTFVLRNNLAKTIRQARQLIVHGHIAVNGVKTTIPSYMVMRDDEDKITYIRKSSFSKADHPEIIKIKQKMIEAIKQKEDKIKEDKSGETGKKEEMKRKEDKQEKIKKEKRKEIKKEKKETKEGNKK
ncbi:30S ribosomal protein S4 [Candidatus Woesearchaeota archaeon]|nr:30S ribosomal protein S4 [Candidatus Woesearchaeota archaeon]